MTTPAITPEEPLVDVLRAGKNWLNGSSCCGQKDSVGTCAAPACIFGEALKYFHLAADEIDRQTSMRQAAEARIERLEAALRPLAQARCTGPGAFNRADLSDEDFERARAALEGETK